MKVLSATNLLNESTTTCYFYCLISRQLFINWKFPIYFIRIPIKTLINLLVSQKWKWQTFLIIFFFSFNTNINSLPVYQHHNLFFISPVQRDTFLISTYFIINIFRLVILLAFNIPQLMRRISQVVEFHKVMLYFKKVGKKRTVWVYGVRGL